MSESIVSVRNISKSFGGRKVVDNLSLSVAPGEVFGLLPLIKSPVMKLSGGERQKLSVVLSLIGNPEIVFLDELTTGLDVAARREVWRTLKELKAEGMTIFLTTHYMEEAENLCDRVCLIKNGCKVTEGTVSEVVAASPYNNLEDAYLWYMGEEVM